MKEECDLTFTEYSGFYMLSSKGNPSSRRFEHGRRHVDLLRVHRGNNLDQLFGVGALAHRRLPPIRGLCGKCHWFSPHSTFLPVRAVQVTATPCFVLPLVNTGPRQQWLNSGSPQQTVSLARGGFPTFQGVCLVRIDGYETVLEQEQRYFRQRCG